MKFLSKYSAHLITGIVFIYMLLAFISPVLSKLGYKDIGNNIANVYSRLCHQRVERSIFLFGKEKFISTYTVDHLKGIRYLPQESKLDVWPEYFGNELNGNEEIGYKVSICIRDIAIYGSFLIVSIVLLVIKKTDVSPTILLLLILPLVIDGVFETVIEIFRVQSIPLWIVNDIWRRVSTGVLFGIGTSLFLIPMLKKLDY